MLRLLLALLLLATPASAGMVIGSGADYSDIILWEDFTDAADPYSITSSNCNTGTATAWTLNGAVVAINATAKLTGDYGVQCPGGSDYATLAIDAGDYFNSTKGAVVFAFKQVTADPGQGLFKAEGTTDLIIRVVPTGDSDDIRTTWDGAVLDTAVNFTTNTWYWVVFAYDTDAEDRKLHIYTDADPPVEVGTGVEDLTTAIAPLDTVASIEFGEYAGMGDEGELYMDHLVIFDGTISRTPLEYVTIAKGASCPL